MDKRRIFVDEIIKPVIFVQYTQNLQLPNRQ